jgi:hypothetical protein
VPSSTADIYASDVTQDTHHHRWMVIRFKLDLTSYVLSAETGEAALRRRSDIPMLTTRARYILVLTLFTAPIGIAMLSHEPLRAGSAAVQIEPNTGTARLSPPQIDLGSLDRCGCRFSRATSYRQPDHCRLNEKPNLVSLEGYLRTGDRTVDKGAPPWRIRELNQTGPQKWDGFLGRRTAKTRVRITAVQTDDSSPSNARLQVHESANGADSAFWISLQDFDPVPWWHCPADKAVEHSAILARPKPNARPVTLEGRWIQKPPSKRLWCWTSVPKVGVYCDPSPTKPSGSFDPWIYQPEDLEIEY